MKRKAVDPDATVAQKRARKSASSDEPTPEPSIETRLVALSGADSARAHDRAAMVRYLASSSSAELNAIAEWSIQRGEALHVRELQQSISAHWPHGRAQIVSWYKRVKLGEPTGPYAFGEGRLLALRGRERKRALILTQKQLQRGTYQRDQWTCILVNVHDVHRLATPPVVDFLPVLRPLVTGLHGGAHGPAPLQKWPGAHFWVSMNDPLDKEPRRLTAVLLDYPGFASKTAPAGTVLVQVRPSKGVPKRFWGDWRLSVAQLERLVLDSDVHAALADTDLASCFPSVLLRFLAGYCVVW